VEPRTHSAGNRGREAGGAVGVVERRQVTRDVVVVPSDGRWSDGEDDSQRPTLRSGVGHG